LLCSGPNVRCNLLWYITSIVHPKSLALPLLFGALLLAHADSIPQEKLALIQKAMQVMQVESRMNAFVGRVVAVKVKRIQNDNPGISDSVVNEVQKVISEVYLANLDTVDGLYPQLYQVVDTYLTEDDLKFVVNYNGSDGGQRYAKLAPQIIQNASRVESNWNAKLQPVIRQKLKEKFQDLKLESMQ
jgi:hypothetical protein